MSTQASAGRAQKGPYQKRMATTNVMTPVMIMSLSNHTCQRAFTLCVACSDAHHCHAWSTVEWMCSVPYATSPSRMIAAPFIRTASKRSSGQRTRIRGRGEWGQGVHQ